jgi:serine/threonine protein kinase
MATLDPARWKAVSPYLDHVLEMPAAERAIWLASLGAQDPVLAGDLQALAAEYEALNRTDFLAGTASRRPHPFSVGTPLAGQIVGAYTLVSRIGSGGMGTVWLAQRSDGRFEGHAAVKLLDASLIGRAGEERFIREGTILARLTHPSIAHLTDAGVSPGGQPYLVLEYVQGEHIDTYCDNRYLDIESRIRLFLDVLTAVAHAHAHLVVHRDIKPSNVLVANPEPDHASPAHRVKLLDFGIAKLLVVDADATIALTCDSGWALTPEYAAPEQLTGQPVTTATDVYSLGVLLYVLLGGRHPSASGLRSPAALIEVIVNAEAPRLSDVVRQTTTWNDESLAATAARRHTTPDILRRALEGDLDTIVAKALKKDPQERYPSVTAFADDLRRYLDQPIAARPDALSYRTAKFVRRHRVPVALATLAGVAVVVGLIGTLTQARRATRQAALADMQRQRADQETRTASAQRDFALRQLSRAEAISDLNTFLLSDTAPSARPFTASELLGRAEHIVERQQATDENQVEMLISIGRQYLALDDDAKGRALLSTAYELSRALPDRGTGASAACALASTIAKTGDGDRAERLLQEGFGALPNEPQYVLHRVFCYLRGGEVSVWRGEGPRGLARVRAAQALSKDSGLSTPLLEYRVSMALAEIYSGVGRYREAIDAYADASRTLASLGRDDTETAGTLFNSWGAVLALLGRPLEAEPLLRRGIRIQRRTDGREEPTLPMQFVFFARALSELRRFPEAAEAARSAYESARRAGAGRSIDLALLTRASIARQLGDLRGAAHFLRDVEARLKCATPPGDLIFATLASERALLSQARGDTTAALASADRAIAIAEASRHVPLAPRFLVRRSQLALQLHRVEQARADAARALATAQAAVGPGDLSCEIGRAHLALGRALLSEGKRAEARTAFASALEHLAPTLGADHADTRQARQLAAADALSR